MPWLSVVLPRERAELDESGADTSGVESSSGGTSSGSHRSAPSTRGELELFCKGCAASRLRVSWSFAGVVPRQAKSAELPPGRVAADRGRAPPRAAPPPAEQDSSTSCAAARERIRWKEKKITEDDMWDHKNDMWGPQVVAANGVKSVVHPIFSIPCTKQSIGIHSSQPNTKWDSFI